MRTRLMLLMTHVKCTRHSLDLFLTHRQWGTGVFGNEFVVVLSLEMLDKGAHPILRQS